MGLRAPIKELPSREVLHRLFAYDTETGVLTWKPRPGVRGFKEAGNEAGTIAASGYRIVGIEKKYYAAHRIIWKMMTGADPDGQIDHIDNDRLNNRWANFRIADNKKNKWNGGLYRNNRSGYRGVQFRPQQPRRPWRAVLAIGHRKYLHLGSYETPELAHEAWSRAAVVQRGEFFRP